MNQSKILNVCPLNVSKVNYVKTVKDTQNLRPQYRKASRIGFQIIFYMFNLNVKERKPIKFVATKMAPKARALLHTSF